MAAISYPSTLPAPMAPLVVRPAERRALSVPARPRDAAALERDERKFGQVTFPPFNAVQAAAFQEWWTDTLVHGAAWFAATWPLPAGLVAKVWRFIGRPDWQFVPGGYWRVTADVEVLGRALAPRTTGPVIQLAFNGTAGTQVFTDEGSAGAVWTATAAGVQLSAGWSVEGTALRIPSDSDGLWTPYTDDIALTNSDFTVEFQVYPDAGARDGRDWFGIFDSSGFISAWGFYTGLSGGGSDNRMFFFWRDSTGVEHNVESTITLPVSTRTHIAATRRGQRVSIWQGGEERDFVTDFAGTINQPASSRLYFGKNLSGGSVGKAGYFDLVRVWRGRALYTETFTPPDAF